MRVLFKLMMITCSIFVLFGCKTEQKKPMWFNDSGYLLEKNAYLFEFDRSLLTNTEKNVINAILDKYKVINGYRIEIFVCSSQAKLVEISNYGEKLIGVYPVGTATTAYDADNHFGKEFPVTKVLVNPPWTPTKDMLKRQASQLSQGKKPKFLYRKFKPGEKGNPLGSIAIYPVMKGFKDPLRMHNTPGHIPKKKNPDGTISGARISSGCARADMNVIVPVASVITDVPENKIKWLIDTNECHKLTPKFATSMIFFMK